MSGILEHFSYSINTGCRICHIKGIFRYLRFSGSLGFFIYGFEVLGCTFLRRSFIGKRFVSLIAS